MIHINPELEENWGHYAACVDCCIEGHTIKYKRDWAIAWHMFKHGEDPKKFFEDEEVKEND